MIKKLFFLISLGVVASAFHAVEVAEVQPQIPQDISHPVVINADEDQVDSGSFVDEQKLPLESPQVVSSLRNEDVKVAALPDATVVHDAVNVVPQKRSIGLTQVEDEMDQRTVGLGRYKGRWGK